MSGDDSSNSGNRTVFRPSPLSGMRQGQGGGAGQPPASPPPTGFPPSSPPPFSGGFQNAPPAVQPSGFAPPPPAAYEPPPAGFSADPQVAPGAGMRRIHDDDVPVPATPRAYRSTLVSEAGPVLALAASVRSGRARISMPEFHREASEAIAAYDRAVAAIYPEEVRVRARYALCATVDDIAQNLPNIGQDGAEWARRSLVVQFFRENIGGERFWQLVDELLARPGQNGELIELFADCLAAGFEGRFRVMPDGRSRLQQIMAQLYGALEHPRAQTMRDLSPQWRGAEAPLARIGLWNRVALAGAVALAALLGVFILLRLILMASGADSYKSAQALTPREPLRLSRLGAPPPSVAESDQLVRLREFLAPEISQKLVAVDEDGLTVRVRTTVGQLFQSGSDQLESGRTALFERIGRAVEGEPGQVTVEGHADSDQLSSLSFPDNTALSRARAQTVSGILGSVLSNPGRIAVEGYGESRPIATNETAEGKALNRRVEILIPRKP
ncbi:MAG: type IVB secretion system protein IcmH/DotU [Caenibius sp.]